MEILSTGMGRGAAIAVIFSAKESFYMAAFEQVGAYFGFEALGKVCETSGRPRLARVLTVGEDVGHDAIELRL